MGSNHNSTGGTAGGAAGGAAGGGLTSLASARSGAESESFYSVGDPWDAGEDSWPEGWEGGQEGEEHEGAKGGGSGAADKGHEGKGEGEGQLLPLAGSGGDGEAAEGGCGGQLAAAARARRPVLRVPVTQAPPLLSEDRMLEQQAAMERLAVHPQGGCGWGAGGGGGRGGLECVKPQGGGAAGGNRATGHAPARWGWVGWGKGEGEGSLECVRQ